MADNQIEIIITISDRSSAPINTITNALNNLSAKGTEASSKLTAAAEKAAARSTVLAAQTSAAVQKASDVVTVSRAKTAAEVQKADNVITASNARAQAAIQASANTIAASATKAAASMHTSADTVAASQAKTEAATRAAGNLIATSEIRKATVAQTSANTVASSATRMAASLQTSANNVVASEARAAAAVQTSAAAITAANARAAAAVARADAAIAGAGQRASSHANQFGFMASQVNKLASMFEGVLIGMVAFQAMRLPSAMIGTAVQAYAAYERLGLTLKNLLAVELTQKDASLLMRDAMGQVTERSQELIKWTEQLAILSPFTQETVAYTLQTAMGYGMNSDMAQKLTQALADYAAGTGRSEDQTKLLGLALGQVWSKGKLTGEEMRQLTNAGMGVEFMATAAGMSLKDFTEVMKDGELDARQLIPRLIELSDERFAGAAKAQATSWAGLLSTLDDITKIGLRTFFTDTLQAIQPHLADFLDAWPKFKKDLASAGANFANFGGAVVRTLGNMSNAWQNMGEEGQHQLEVLGLYLVGPIAIGAVGGMYKAVVGLIGAFKTLKLGAIVELVALFAAAAYIAEKVSIGMQMAVRPWVRPGTEEMKELIANSWTAKQFLGDVATKASELGENLIDAAGGLREMRTEGIPGIEGLKNAFSDVTKEFQRMRVEMPTMEELAKAWIQVNGEGELLTATQDALIRNYERLNNVSIKVAKAQEDIGAAARGSYPPIAATGGATKDASKAAEDAAKAYQQMVESMRNIIASSSQVVSYLVSIDPAAMAAAAAVDTLRLRLLGLQDQQAGLQDSIKASQAVLRAMQAEVGRLGDALAAAKQRLADLAAPRLKGMGEFDSQIAAVERQLKRLKLVDTMVPSLQEIKDQFKDLVRVTNQGGVTMTQFGLTDEEAQTKLSELRKKAMEDVKKQFPEMTKEMQDYLDTLPNTAEGLQKILEKLELTKELKFDEALKKLADAANGVKEELTFEEALKQIEATKNEISSLEGQLSAAKTAAELQTQAIEAMQAASEEMSKAIQQMQADLKTQEERQKLVNDALKIAYDWFVDDRLKLMALGGEATLQAGIIDDKTRTLLSTTSAYAQSEAAEAIKAIRAALNEYLAARAIISAGLGMGGGSASSYAANYAAAKAEWERQRAANGEDTSDDAWREHARAIGLLARGTSFWRGGLALVGEQGPELVNLPRGSQVYPSNVTNQTLGGATYILNLRTEQPSMGIIQDWAYLKMLAGA